MAAIDDLVAALEERRIAQEVGLRHDEARGRFRLDKNTVASWDEFMGLLGRYYSYHFSACIARGATMDPVEAEGRAQEAIEREYRRRRGDIVTAYNDAHDGTNAGCRGIVDLLADSLKAEGVERYIRSVFSRYVAPNSWPAKVEIIRQFIRLCGRTLGSAIDPNDPERYASESAELIRAYVNGLQQSSPLFRRL